MSNYQGDYPLGSTSYFTFTTVDSSGVGASLASTSLLEVYRNASTTPSTIGLTLTTDLNGRTGLNRVKAILDSTTYATGDEVSISIQTGLIGSKSAVGYVVGSLSIEARSALRPTTAGRTLAVDTSNRADASIGNVQNGINGLQRAGTAQAVSATTLTMDAAASYADNSLVGNIVKITNGTNIGATGIITSNVGATDVVTLSAGWSNGATPTGTPTFEIWGTAPGASLAQIATAVWQDTTAGDFTVASSIGKALYVANVAPGGSGGHMISGSNSGTTTLGALTVTGGTTLTGAVSASNGSNSITGVAVGTGGITAASLAADAITAAKVAADVGTEIASAVITAAAATPIDANVQKVNDVTLQGTGISSDKWRPV